jgi:hypothetical protein
MMFINFDRDIVFSPIFAVIEIMKINFGRDIVFSADLCYNGANRKPPSEREGDRVSGGRSLRDFRFVLTSL